LLHQSLYVISLCGKANQIVDKNEQQRYNTVQIWGQTLIAVAAAGWSDFGPHWYRSIEINRSVDIVQVMIREPDVWAGRETTPAVAAQGQSTRIPISGHCQTNVLPIRPVVRLLQMLSVPSCCCWDMYYSRQPPTRQLHCEPGGGRNPKDDRYLDDP
jgi:hypothetical protein